MFQSNDQLGRAAELARLLDTMISAMSSDPRLSGIKQFEELSKILKRLISYIEQSIRGERSSDWFNMEALAVREALTRMAKTPEFRGSKDLKPTSIEIVTDNAVTTKDEITHQLALAGVHDSEYS